MITKRCLFVLILTIKLTIGVHNEPIFMTHESSLTVDLEKKPKFLLENSVEIFESEKILILRILNLLMKYIDSFYVYNFAYTIDNLDIYKKFRYNRIDVLSKFMWVINYNPL